MGRGTSDRQQDVLFLHAFMMPSLMRRCWVLQASRSIPQNIALSRLPAAPPTPQGSTIRPAVGRTLIPTTARPPGQR